MPIGTALTAFRAEIATHQGYITNAFVQDAAGNYLMGAQQQSFVVDSAFLRMFIAWETFLEEVFVRYLLGNPSVAGTLAVLFANPGTEERAREMLVGTQKYVDWANPEIVRKLSRIYFNNGEPIGPAISAIQSDLFDLKTVRNAAAHLTTTTGRLLDALATRRLGHNCINISVSGFVLAPDPTPGAAGSILDSYIVLLDATAHNIANWV
ncbi:hypothetical protein LBMAG57_26720 [Verrucomicrobiota bacterium]|nr:hypothetical protein LBMAG57_26720 [Verrucomicrobiota bacterium]